MLSVLLALLAAVANALASVLQRKAARGRPESESLSLRLIWHLLHRPVWLAGILSIIAGFLLQATALGHGQLSVVQPVLVMELPATLLLASLVFKSRLGLREWGASALMAAGLAGLLFFLSPSSGSTTDVGGLLWAVASGVNVAVVAALVVWASFAGPGSRKAALLGVATGCTFGFTAALIKGLTVRFTQGFAALFTSWQLYAMIVAGAGAMFLLQSAMQAGRLLATQPGLTMADPVVAIMWGVFVFGEAVRGGVYILLSVVAAAVVATGVVLLSRSPLLTDESGRNEHGQDEHGQDGDGQSEQGPSGRGQRGRDDG
ncbi:DMT family transporter [Streptomyces anandii]|uniref:DMT family transporter n=1 Tax=Streptomyces anandii TaxID=285454 RepID=UPI0036F892E9